LKIPSSLKILTPPSIRLSATEPFVCQNPLTDNGSAAETPEITAEINPMGLLTTLTDNAQIRLSKALLAGRLMTIGGLFVIKRIASRPT
jgi:hypothetical protein